MTQLKVLADSRAAKVQITVAHAEVVTAIGVIFDGEGWGGALVENDKGRGDDLNLTRGDVLVLALALADGAGHLNDVFTAELGCRVVEGGVGLRVEDDLCDAITVADVNERHAAHLA